MYNVNRKKFFDAIYSYLSETIESKKAEIQTNIMIDNINETLIDICIMIENKSTDFSILSRKFHTLKNLLLYGDFYYESDLCQDIEIILRSAKSIENIIPTYEDLIYCINN